MTTIIGTRGFRRGVPMGVRVTTLKRVRKKRNNNSPDGLRRRDLRIIIIIIIMGI